MRIINQVNINRIDRNDGVTLFIEDGQLLARLPGNRIATDVEVSNTHKEKLNGEYVDVAFVSFTLNNKRFNKQFTGEDIDVARLLYNVVQKSDRELVELEEDDANKYFDELGTSILVEERAFAYRYNN